MDIFVCNPHLPCCLLGVCFVAHQRVCDRCRYSWMDIHGYQYSAGEEGNHDMLMMIIM